MDKNKCIEILQKLEPEILSNIFAYIQIAYNAQENLRRQYGLSPDGYPAQSGAKAKAQQAEGAI
jgi:hypothetical protein